MMQPEAGRRGILAGQASRPLLRSLAKAVIPPSVRGWLRDRHLTMWPPVGMVRLGHLRRVRPIDRDYGWQRGLPTDRYYIESFLAKQAHHIHGRVLEVKDNTYTRRFGGDRVMQSDVLDLTEAPDATIVGNLATGQGLPSDAFDCMIVTQTFHLIDEIERAIQNSYRSLRPGGVLLATLPGISRICRDEQDRWADHWRFTTRSARRLFGAIFPPDGLAVEAHGNVLAATAFLYGLAAQELRRHELEYHDPDYEVLITVKGAKPGA